MRALARNGLKSTKSPQIICEFLLLKMTKVLENSNSKVTRTSRNCYILIAAFLRNLLNTQLELSQVNVWQIDKKQTD